MNNRHFVAQFIKRADRPYDSESWDQFLRRRWPDLADLFLISDRGERACALADAHEELAHARQTFAYCRDDADPADSADKFLRGLDNTGEDNEPDGSGWSN
jgi:hypothetical protein